MSDHEFNRWKENVYNPANSKYPERKSGFSSESHIPIEPLYSGENIPDELGYPGEYPYTRGIQPSMYRGKLWTMRQYAGFSTPEDSNSRYKHLLSEGQTGLSVAFDLPTQTGYDADHDMARGEIGRVGVPISSLADMEILFEGIPINEVTTSMTINSTAPMLLALYLAVAKKQGVAFDKVRGTTQNDILKEYIARGTYIFPPKQSIRLITDMFSFCSREVPLWNTISISGYHVREAGATASQELAFTLTNGIAYVQAAIDAGLDIDEFAGRLSFFFVAHNNLFEEAAKFRAARRMWADIMKNHFGAKNPRSWMLRFHTQTAGVTLQAQQPEVNVIRTTLQALAAVLGGTQSLHVNSKDEALGLPTEESATLALRTQQVIANESGVADTIDPLGGSYFVEALTDAVESESRKLMKSIQKMGGSIAAIERGFQKKIIEDSAYEHLKLVESGERVIVGINAFASNFDEQIQLQVIPEDAATRQINRLKQVRQQRDNSTSDLAIKQLQETARSGENMMPAIIDCVQSYSTLGEICDTLRSEFGVYQLPSE